MPPILQGFLQKPREEKIFLAIIAIAILARLFTIAAMPDPQLADTLYHLNITKYVAEHHALPQVAETGEPIDIVLPLYYFVTALPFALLPIPLNPATAKIFPLIFSALQLLLAFLLLKSIFPKKWHAGLAFVAIHPLLIIFGSVNYIETFASLFVLLAFLAYIRFAQTRKSSYLIAMPFILAGLAMSKLSATALVPGFFLMFLLALAKTREKNIQIPRKNLKILYFAAASILLCSAWFAIDFLSTGSIVIHPQDIEALSETPERISLSLETVLLTPLRLNNAFWFSLMGDLPFGQFNMLAEIAIVLITFPILLFALYGLAKGLLKKEPASLLLLICILLALLPLFGRSTKFIHGRMLLPIVPLFGIAFANAFKQDIKPLFKKAFLALFCILAFYSLSFSASYAWHFQEDYSRHMPLFQEISELPEGTLVAMQPHKARQVNFIFGEKALIYRNEYQELDAPSLLLELRTSGATHIAETCYKNPWRGEIVSELTESGNLEEAFSDDCTTLYKIQ